MAKKKRIKGASGATALPTGPVLLGRLVRALGSPTTAPGFDDFAGRTALRFFSGERIEDDTIHRIFAGLGVAFVELGFAPAVGWRPTTGPSPTELVERALRHMVARWDATIAEVRRGRLLDGAAPKVIVLAAARLLVVDVAMRAAAWSVLTAPLADDRATATPPDTAAVLRDLIERTKLSHEAIAVKCKCQRTTVDDWAHGARPTDDNLANLALLVDDGRSADTVLARARRDLALADMVTSLRTYLGPDHDADVDELWHGVIDMTARFSRFMARSRLVGEERFGPPSEVVALGVEGRPAKFVISDALKQEVGSWAAVLEVGPAWADYLVHAARVARSAGSVVKAGFTEEAERGAIRLMLDRPRHHAPPVRPGWDYVRTVHTDHATKAANRIAQYHDAVARGDGLAAVAHARRAVELTPQEWLPHFLLAAGLGRIGDVANGIAECWLAASLATSERDIDLAKVEVGIILTNVGRNEEACAHLEDLLAATSAPSTHLLYNLGIVRMRCGMFEKALDALRRALAADEYNPHALDAAAHCAFMVGDRPGGIAYAKQANLLGVTDTYEAWRNGMYPRRNGKD